MPQHTALTLEYQSHAQRERLAFIDFCLQYHGAVGRGELMAHFGTAVASGARDFALYRERAPNNLVLRHGNKRYYRTDCFQPLFHHDSRAVLNTLAHGFDDGLTMPQVESGFCEDVPDLIASSQGVLATLSRAINQGQAVRLAYLPLNSGQSERVIVPHSIINNGQRWHVRGFCRKQNQFRDFVCTRVTNSHINDTPVVAHEQQVADTEWNHWLTLELVPHPGHRHPEAVALDFNMSRENNQPVRRLKIRVARAGYLLHHWQVDLSPDHHLPAHEYHLWLSNSNTICHNTLAL
ncbi:WYL domain-containing protein [Nitrosomonas cryotolerans]|uniref:WYL domain-containing protein n=1 Tax=Nitrosomonas cryotolerans ATCC 49181 TaxID=1131553 RepID=A0A1N6GVW9_9PROT|nr:WYL domain-containing protein [Nitrosomonas cryotolerans]SFP41655.1 WYL domain-containing protein [Nitrosomonas cryotolerans]SIO11693.1 WYL domain-containing protein [Nitrosomonas cryotolerans ATCC 49181]